MIKDIRFIFFLATITLLSGCAKEEDKNSSIPDRRVEIDIQKQIENNFDNPYYSKKYYKTETTPYAGYAGILAISSIEKSIYAYDLCCPHEAPIINEIQVLKNQTQAQCPKCKSVFEIAVVAGVKPGRVISGPSSEGLRSYRVIPYGSFFQIRN